MSSSDSVAVRAEAPRGLGLWVATLVSYGVNPLILPPLVYAMVLAHVGASRIDVLWGAGIGLAFLALVPLAYVGWMRSQGRIESLEIRKRSKRTEPFLVVLGAGLAALGTVLGIEITGQRLLAALVGCHVLNTVILFLITTQWKISVHCASVAGAVATLGFVHSHVPGIVLSPAVVGNGVLAGGAVLVVLILWARIRSRAHTFWQAAAGAGLGLAPYAELLTLARFVGL